MVFLVVVGLDVVVDFVVLGFVVELFAVVDFIVEDEFSDAFVSSVSEDFTSEIYTVNDAFSVTFDVVSSKTAATVVCSSVKDVLIACVVAV